MERYHLKTIAETIPGGRQVYGRMRDTYRYAHSKWPELEAYFHYLARPTSAGSVRVVIFGQGRTGSTLLENLLASTGHFQEHGELLRTDEREVYFPERFIIGCSKANPGNFIFHVKIYQLIKDRKRPVDPAAFLSNLYRKDWKILYLRRRNTVRLALSYFVAESRGAFHKYNDAQETHRVHVDCGRFVDFTKERLEFDEAEKRALAGLEHHEIVYEEGLENTESHQATVNRVLGFLALEPKTVSTRHKKVNTTPLSELIVNYDEFRKCLRENHWEHFIADEA